jgi:uncharacterized protein YdhG (YjbR/CyaY superfamily)
MANPDFRSIDDYAASLAPATRPVFERARETIRKAVPKAGETVSYQIAGFTIDGRVFLFLAGWKEHISLYPITDGLLAALPEVSKYVASKGTIRLPLNQRLPIGLIRRIAQVRAKEHAAAEAQKARTKAARKKPGASPRAHKAPSIRSWLGRNILRPPPAATIHERSRRYRRSASVSFVHLRDSSCINPTSPQPFCALCVLCGQIRPLFVTLRAPSWINPRQRRPVVPPPSPPATCR